MLNKIITGISVFIFLSGCNPKINTKESKNIRVEFNKIKDLTLNDLFDTITVIPLVTQKNCLLGSLKKIISNDGYFYLQDNFQKVITIFDSKGDYFGKINSFGKGPEQYLRLGDFTVNLLNGHVYIADRYYVCEYNKLGKFVNRFKIFGKENDFIHNVEFLNDSLLVCVSSTDDIGCHIYDLKKKEITVSQGVYSGIAKRSFYKGYKILSHADGIVTFMRSFSNEIYHVTPEGFIKAYNWDFGKLTFDYREHLLSSISEKKDKKKLRFYSSKYVFPIMFSIEDSENVMASFAYGDRCYTALHNKKMNKTILLDNLLSMLFMTRCPSFDENGNLVVWIDYKMVKILKDQFPESIKNTVLNIKRDDNPIIMILSIRSSYFDKI